MTKIVTLKLSNGEELITRFNDDEGENFVVINDPLVLHMVQSHQGAQIVLVPWMHSKPRGEFVISKDHILTSAETDKQYADGYLSQVSGIQLSA